MNQVIKLSATWCGPCKQYAPVFNEISSNHSDRWEVASFDIDTDEGRELSVTHGIRSVPATIFMEFGKDPKVVVGSMSSEDLDGHLSFS
tara:strand:- start:60 stop:326 length:267 start_codon:yes stop_codon:yes gene_type:complete